MPNGKGGILLESYITIDEAAKLEGVKYMTLYMKIQRNQEEYKTKTIPSENGGKDRLLVSVESLSKKARRTYKAQNEVIDEENAPWYVGCDFNWYKESYKKYFYEAIELSKYVEEYIDFEGKGKTALAKKLAKKCGISSRTFLVRVKEYIEAGAWANKMQEASNKNYDYFKILALCRKPREKNTFPSMTDEVKAMVDNIFYSKGFQENNQPITNLYEELEYMAKLEDVEIPSYDTVWRYVKQIIKEDGEGASVLLGKGTRQWKNQYMMKRKRDTGNLKVMEVLQGDVHSFDCWVAVKRPNGKMQAIRPALVAWMDMRSRTLVGWAIAEHPDSQIIKKSLINVIYPKKNKALPYGVPKYLLIDNGKEYTAEALTGRPRKIRVTLDADTKGFYRSIGIEDDMRSLPFQPWSKAQVERFFGTVCQKFSKRMNSYTGTLSGQKTSAKVKKDIKGMLEAGELMDIEEFSQKFEEWVAKNYHTRKHGGLKEQGEESPIPIDVFNSAERYFKAAPPLDYTLSLLMKSEERKVTSMGIKITRDGKPIYYQHQDLDVYINQRVDIRYHPEDITKIFVYDKEGNKICEAVSYELLRIAPKVSEKGFIEHNKDQKRQLKNEKDRIKYRQMSYEERLQREKELLENADKKIVTPELSGEKQKITSIPEDKQYKDEIKGKTKKSTTKQKNEYFERQAAKALAALRKLG
jgi:transposase InsO family protein